MEDLKDALSLSRGYLAIATLLSYRYLAISRDRVFRHSEVHGRVMEIQREERREISSEDSRKSTDQAIRQVGK